MQYVWKTFWNCEQFEQAHQTRAWFPMIVCKTNTKYWKYKWFLKDTTFFIIYTIFLCLNLFQGNITGFLLSQKKHIFAHSVQTDTAAKLLWRIMSKVMRAKQAVRFVEDHFPVYQTWTSILKITIRLQRTFDKTKLTAHTIIYIIKKHLSVILESLE